MTLTRYFSGVAIAALTVIGGLASTQPAMAEDLVDFLWGGSAEFGGGRATVSFDPQYKPGHRQTTPDFYWTSRAIRDFPRLNPLASRVKAIWAWNVRWMPSTTT